MQSNPETNPGRRIAERIKLVGFAYEELVNKYAYKIFGQPFADSSREQAREVST